MAADQNPQHPQKEGVIVDPEGWETIKAKYKEREDEKIKELLSKRKAESVQDLIKVAENAIVKRATRAAADRKPLGDRTIQRETKNEEIKSLREKLNAEITSIQKRALQELPGIEKKVPALKGRVQLGPPGQPAEEPSPSTEGSSD